LGEQRNSQYLNQDSQKIVSYQIKIEQFSSELDNMRRQMEERDQRIRSNQRELEELYAENQYLKERLGQVLESQDNSNLLA
jgi:regulator of replication initiation timing